MNDIKATIAKNISELRQSKGMTQIELAQKLNYSDKAVSKWERAESMPDITVLVQISQLFGVTLDYLVEEEHKKPEVKKKEKNTAPRHNRGFIAGISILLVWFIALLVFVTITLAAPTARYQWLAFVYAIPVSMIVWLVFNSVWFNKRLNYLIISLLMWSSLSALYVSLLPFGLNIWLVFLLGIPGQLIILLWSNIRIKQKKTEN